VILPLCYIGLSVTVTVIDSVSYSETLTKNVSVTETPHKRHNDTFSQIFREQVS